MELQINKDLLRESSTVFTKYFREGIPEEIIIQLSFPTVRFISISISIDNHKYKYHD